MLTAQTHDDRERVALADLLRTYSVEITAHDEKALKAVESTLAPGTEVFIANLPDERAEVLVAAALRVRRAGLEPVPHIVARNLKSRDDLDGMLASLVRDAGVSTALILGGDRDRQAGNFENALQIIETGLLEAHGIRRIAIGCYPEGHPRHILTFDEQVAAYRAVTLDQVRQFHRDFYGADHAEFSFVGDFDPAALETQLVSLFGDWKSPDGYERIPDPYRPSEVVDLRLETPDKANAVFLFRTDYPMTQDDPDYPAMEVATWIFGGGALKSRLGDRLRQQEGLSYGAGASHAAGILDEDAQFSGYAIAAPENAAKVRTAFREELERLLAEGITRQELDDAVAGLLKARAQSRNEDANLVGTLDFQLYYDFTMQRDADYEQALQALTVEQVNAALRRRIDPERISIVLAGDFAADAG